MGESILSRVSESSPDLNPDNATLTQRQTQVDSGVSSATRQLIDPIFIASSIVGAAAYEATRWGTIKAGRSLIKKSLAADIKYIKNIKGTWWGGTEVIGQLVPDEFVMKYKFMGFASRIGSYGLAAAAGSSTQELAYRSLSSLTETEPENPDLWHWNGEGGIKNGLIHAFCTVGPAYITSEQGLRFARRVNNYKPPTPFEKGAIGTFVVLSFGASYSLFDYLVSPKDSDK